MSKPKHTEFTAYLNLIEQIDEHLTRDTRHYRDNDGRLLLHLDQVVRAILADKLDQEKPMTVIFNFSHPLSEKAQQQITEAIGENEVHTIRIQLDLQKAIKPQVFALCEMIYTEFGNPNYLILPGHAVAAGFITQWFSQAKDDYPPVTAFIPVIWLKQESLNEGHSHNMGVPQFILGGIE